MTRSVPARRQPPSAERAPAPPLLANPVAKALRRRRLLRGAVVVALVSVGFASYASHRSAPVDTSSLDGARVFVGDFTGRVRARDVKDGKPVGELTTNPE